MKRLVSGLCVAIVLIEVWAFKASASANQGAIERGKYLVTIGACNDCHTPWKLTDKGPEPDMTRMLSGHPEAMKLPPPPALPPGPWGAVAALSMTAWSGPWGVSYTANLTPDEETGVGALSEDNFIKSMRTGQHLGSGRPILPPMPWDWIGKMTDGDLKAVFAYLKTIKPIKNHVPDPVLPAPMSAPAKAGK